MIDFRYHLVSLISVFLALAVGIILGAGPLQNAIGDQLTDQVEALRAERTELRESLSANETAREQQHSYAVAAGQELVAGSLEGVRVAVIEVEDVEDPVELDVVNQLEAAGARVVAQATYTDAWTSADEEVLRGTVANGQRAELGSLVDESAETSEVLGSMLGVALTESSEQMPEERSERAVTLYQLLSQVGLVESRFEPSAPADAVLFLGASPSADGSTEESSPEESEDVDVPATISALQEVADDVVVAGPTSVDNDVIAQVRADEDLASRVSTVSGTEQDLMRLNVPLAVAAQLADEVGQYGFEEDAVVVPPAAEVSGSGQDGDLDVEPDPGTESVDPEDASDDSQEDS